MFYYCHKMYVVHLNMDYINSVCNTIRVHEGKFKILFCRVISQKESSGPDNVQKSVKHAVYFLYKWVCYISLYYVNIPKMYILLNAQVIGTYLIFLLPEVS